MDPVTLDAGLRMMLVDRFGVRGVQHAIDLVVLVAEQDVVVRDPELVRRCILQLAQLVRRERLHGMGIDELRHGCHLLPPGRRVLVERLPATLGPGNERR